MVNFKRGEDGDWRRQDRTGRFTGVALTHSLSLSRIACMVVDQTWPVKFYPLLRCDCDCDCDCDAIRFHRLRFAWLQKKKCLPRGRDVLLSKVPVIQSFRAGGWPSQYSQLVFLVLQFSCVAGVWFREQSLATSLSKKDVLGVNTCSLVKAFKSL